jgi:hypothetical protein
MAYLCGLVPHLHTLSWAKYTHAAQLEDKHGIAMANDITRHHLAANFFQLKLAFAHILPATAEARNSTVGFKDCL